MSAMLTTRQRQVLDYLWMFLKMCHQLPPAWKISKDFGWESPNAGFEQLGHLERKGMVERNEIGNYMLTSAALALLASPTQQGGSHVSAS